MLLGYEMTVTCRQKNDFNHLKNYFHKNLKYSKLFKAFPAFILNIYKYLAFLAGCE